MRIQIVGQGYVSAAGATPAEARATLLSPRKTWTVDPTTGLPIHPATPPKPGRGLAKFLATNTVNRAALLALHAAERAVPAHWRGTDFAILAGSSRGPSDAWEAHHAAFLAGKPPPPRTSPRTTLGSLAFTLADYFNAPGLATGLSVTCSSGLHAVVQGVALLKSGLAKRVLVGGAESPLTPFTIAQMRALRVYAAAPTDDRPACRPLATPPSGLVLGEGAGFLALELGEDPTLSTVTGIGYARETGRGDTGMSPNGEGFQRAMRMALDKTKDVEAVVAHAPGTRLGDAAEQTAIHTVLGGRVTVLSGKSVTGHTFAASGMLGVERGFAERVGCFAVNAAGFGGNYVTVVVNTHG